jgi:hypothetical protein
MKNIGYIFGSDIQSFQADCRLWTYSRCGAGFSYVVDTLDLLLWFKKRDVFSLLLVLILL